MRDFLKIKLINESSDFYSAEHKYYGKTPIEYLLDFLDFDTTREITGSVNINYDKWKLTQLYCNKGDYDAVKFLIETEVDVNKSTDKFPLLYYAIKVVTHN